MTIENAVQQHDKKLLAHNEMQSSQLILQKFCHGLTKTQMHYLSKYNNFEKLAMQFSPNKQVNFARHSEYCLVGNCPSLADVSCMFGQKQAAVWVECQLKDLWEYIGVKKKIDTLQTEDISRIITSEFYYLKLSELMLFFAQFKAGRYGKFYGGIDPLVITESLQKFKKWRVETLDRVQQEEEQEKRNARPTNDPERITYTEWQELRWLFNMGYERGKDGKIK